MRRSTIAGTIVAAIALLGPVPAWAHDEIAPSTFPIGKPAFLTLSAANEKSVDMVSVTVAAPAGATFGEATNQPIGWNAQHSPSSITWSGGTVRPESFERWGFEVAPVEQPGQLQYAVTLGFDDGDTETANVVVDAVSEVAGAPATTAPATSAVVSTTGVPGTSGGVAADVTLKSDDSDKTNLALGIAIAAGVLALAALGLAARRRSTPGGATGPGRPDQDF